MDMETTLSCQLSSWNDSGSIDTTAMTLEAQLSNLLILTSNLFSHLVSVHSKPLRKVPVLRCAFAVGFNFFNSFYLN